MKKFYSWLLLAISTFQWVGGHICFEVSYFIEVSHQMDELEKSIAAAVKEETGVDATVKILHGEDITPRGHLYSDFFAFSTNIGTETVFYSIEGDSIDVTYEKVTSQRQSRQDEEQQSALLKSLYQDFTIPLHKFSLSIPTGTSTANFQLKELHLFVHPTVLSPPPDLA